MKYIRTKDGRISYLSREPNEEICDYEIITNKGTITYRREDEVIKVANTIEELCDEFVIKVTDLYTNEYAYTTLSYCPQKNQLMIHPSHKIEIYGAIWTDKGLIYVAKMNDKGELELL